MEFLVQVNEEEVEQEVDGQKQMVPVRRWALKVRKDEILVTNNEGELNWIEMSSCKFMGAPADSPRLVLAVKPQQAVAQPGLAVVRQGLPKGPPGQNNN